MTEGGRQEHPCARRQRLVRGLELHSGCQELGSPLGRDKTSAQPLGALIGLEARGRPRGRPRIRDSPGVTEELTPHHLALKASLQHTQWSSARPPKAWVYPSAVVKPSLGSLLAKVRQAAEEAASDSNPNNSICNAGRRKVLQLWKLLGTKVSTPQPHLPPSSSPAIKLMKFWPLHLSRSPLENF